MDNLKDGSGKEEVKKHEWPGRGGILESALHHVLDWSEISRLRGYYDFPIDAASIDTEELAKRFSRESDLERFGEVQDTLRLWNSNPEEFVNPYEENKGVLQKVEPKPKTQHVQVEVEER